MMQIQTDQLDVICRDSLPTLLSLADKSSMGYQVLKNWDCVFRQDSLEATLYTRWMDLFGQRLLKDDFEELAAELNRYYWFRYAISWILERANDAQHSKALAKWCDDQSTLTVESCSDLLQSALDEAGRLPAVSWGHTHATQFTHAFSEVPGLGRLFHRTQEVGGTDHTVWATSHLNNGSYETIWGPSLRMIFDFGSPSENYWILSTVRTNQGQSGDVFSPHYDDMAKQFYNGPLVNMDFHRHPEGHQVSLLKSL
jgi:penicillin amidase